MKRFSLILTLLLLIFLQSCKLPPFEGDLGGTLPKISVSSVSAKPGEYIEVSVSEVLHYPKDVSPSQLTTEFDFGICFRSGDTSGCYAGQPFTIPEDVVVREGESNIVSVKKTFQGGEYFTVKHTFGFTATVPIKLTLIAKNQGEYINTISFERDFVSVTFE